MSALPHLQVGYVAKAHALKGEVLVRTFDPASEVLFEVSRVLSRGRDGAERELTVRDARSAGRELIVSFEEVRSRTEAEALVGATLLVFRDELTAPSEGEYFQGDLIGLAATDEAGRPLGTVEELWTTGEVPTLVIRGPGGELLLPFADAFVGEVDVANRRIVVRPPEYTE